MSNEARLRSLFSGWDQVTVKYYDSLDAYAIQLLVTKQSLEAEGALYHLRMAHRTSQSTQDKLFKKQGVGLRFYGRKASNRGRNR